MCSAHVWVKALATMGAGTTTNTGNRWVGQNALEKLHLSEYLKYLPYISFLISIVVGLLEVGGKTVAYIICNFEVFITTFPLFSINRYSKNF